MHNTATSDDSINAASAARSDTLPGNFPFIASGGARKVLRVQAVALFCISLTVALPSRAFESPATPESALAAFQHDPEVRVELVVAEPLVFQPCALAWDAAGRLFVVENRDYPTGPSPGQPSAAAIIRLDDTDGDGRMDRRTLFATNLTYPNGLMPWNGGLIVTCAPDILFLKDTDGDGYADVQRVLLTGFSTNGSTQLRVSHPLLGPDGWIYITSGLTRPGKISAPEHPGRPAVDIGTDARFNPFTLEIEPVGGRGQFGQTFDEAGNRFHCMNRVHIQQTVIAPRYLARNPNYTGADAVQNVPETMVTDLLGGANQNFAARLYPISENLTTADSHVGTFTAACAVHVYRGNALPAQYRGDAFACDPTANLVHRDRLTEVGPTFASRMVNEGREFLASPDDWFRPVFLADGPDGALYVCDMYRKTIEHPDYLPVEVRKRTDFISGRNRGRIWRITGLNAKSRPTTEPWPAQASREALVQMLGQANVWQRETVQRLLIESPGSEVFRAVEAAWPLPDAAELEQRGNVLRAEGWSALATKTDSSADLFRLNALRTLAILTTQATSNQFTRFTATAAREEAQKQLAKYVQAAALAANPLLRENAWRVVAEHPWSGAHIPMELLPQLATDPNPRARFWLALSLNAHFAGKARIDPITVLAQLASRDGQDRWMRAAMLSGLDPQTQSAWRLARELVQRTESPAPVEFWSDLGQVLGAEQLEAATTNLCDLLAPPDVPATPWRIAALEGVLESARRRGTTASLPAAVQNRFTPVAAQLAAAHSESVATRKAAIGFLASVDPAAATTALLPRLTASEPTELQTAAVRALTSLPGETAVQELLRLEHWNTLSPNTRGAALTALLAQPRHTRELLAAMAAQRLPENMLSHAQREALRHHRDAEIRETARQLFAAAATGDRMAAYEKARAVLDLTGQAVNGHKVFATHCASCHRLDREGYNVGPDLLGIRNQPKESILLHIVHPNYEVVAGFNACTIECQDGRELTGLIIGETPTSVTLRQAQGLEETVPRSGISRLTVGQLSLMPEGLEEAMTPQELADLLACLKGE